MKIQHISWVTCLSLLLLLSACDSYPTATTTASPRTSSTTQKLTPTVTPTSARSGSSSVNCPPANTARPVDLQSAPATASQHIIYYADQGGIQVVESHGRLMSYDVETKKTISLVSFAHPETGIIDAQLSPDGQWVLFVTYLLSGGKSQNSEKLQLVRADGQDLQTLMCNVNLDPVGGQAGQDGVQWSPDEKYIAFNAQGINILDVATGKVEELAHSTHFLVGGWIDDTHLYATPNQVNPPVSPAPQSLYLFDLNSSTNHPIPELSLSSACDTVQVDSTRKQLITTSCASVSENCQGGFGLQGPGTLSIRPVDGGTPTSLYANSSHAILTFLGLDATTYLIYIQNSAGDMSQNGLWKLSTRTHQLTRLTRENAPIACYDTTGYAGVLPEIFSNGQVYTLRLNNALLLGSLQGGTPTTIYKLGPLDDTLHLLGFTAI